MPRSYAKRWRRTDSGCKAMGRISCSFWVRAHNLTDEEGLARSLGEVSDTYLQGVQRNNYLTLMQRVEARDDVTVVDEEILDDDTIVVTIEI